MVDEGPCPAHEALWLARIDEKARFPAERTVFLFKDGVAFGELRIVFQVAPRDEVGDERLCLGQVPGRPKIKGMAIDEGSLDAAAQLGACF